MKKNLLITLFIATLMISSVAGINYIGNSLTYFSSANLAIGKITATERLDVSGNIAVSGTVDGRDIASDGSTLDTLDSNLGSITSAEADQIENIGTTTISGAQWGYLGATDQGLGTSNNVDFNTMTVSPSSAITGLTVDQNNDAKGAYITSDATGVTNYGLHVIAGSGAIVARFERNSNDYVRIGHNNANTFQAYRNLAAADTASPVASIVQDNVGDDQDVLMIQNDGTGSSIRLLSAGGGITMKTPDATSYCLTMANGGTLNVAVGVCTK